MRPYNFAPGPAMLPDAVLRRAQAEMLDWRGLGVSPMEISHRSDFFQTFLTELRTKIQNLMRIPAGYHILFLAGGARGQFAAIPMNLFGKNQQADYFSTGIFSERAISDAKKYGVINIAAKATKSNIPEPATWQLNPNAAYVYYCPNETVNGLRFAHIPETGTIPLVADMTSCIMSEPIDVSRFDLIFASAQKNLGQAGVAIVIVRDTLLDQALPMTPEILNFKTQAAQQSCINTLPTYAVYMLDLMVDWMIDQGGVEALALINQRKAKKLYNCIDHSAFYANHVDAAYRSIMNVPFDVPTDLLPAFLSEANAAGLKYLEGHALVGGARASIYNAMPEAGVDALIAFMDKFAQQNKR